MYFNNHFYLTSLLAFLLSFTAADHCFSIRSWWRTRKGNSLQPLIPYWHLFILRAQVVIVYFFGGVAKLQGDWLQGEPLRHWMKNKPVDLIKAPFSWFPQVLQEEWFIWAMSYGGARVRYKYRIFAALSKDLLASCGSRGSFSHHKQCSLQHWIVFPLSGLGCWHCFSNRIGLGRYKKDCGVKN